MRTHRKRFPNAPFAYSGDDALAENSARINESFDAHVEAASQRAKVRRLFRVTNKYAISHQWRWLPASITPLSEVSLQQYDRWGADRLRWQGAATGWATADDVMLAWDWSEHMGENIWMVRRRLSALKGTPNHRRVGPRRLNEFKVAAVNRIMRLAYEQRVHSPLRLWAKRQDPENRTARILKMLSQSKRIIDAAGRRTCMLPG